MVRRRLRARPACRMYICTEDWMNAMTITVSSRGGSCMQTPGWRYISEKDINENLLARSPCSVPTPIASRKSMRLYTYVN